MGDFDSDGQRDDLAVWRPSNGRWYAIRKDGSVIFDGVQWGILGDVPFVADFDSDNQFDDIAVFRPSNGHWYALRPINGQQIFDLSWGSAGSIPLVGDFDSDGQVDDIGLWRPSDGLWFFLRSNGTVIFSWQLNNLAWPWGRITDIPLVADFDSDNRLDDMGFWRPTDGKWSTTRTDKTVIYQDLPFGAPR